MNKLINALAAAVFIAGSISVITCTSTANTENPAPAAAEKAETASVEENAENSNRAIKVTVSRNGYEPKSFSVKKGQSVKIAFQRTDGENCGEELVFPKLNIRKNLPVGETVTVEFTPQETGELGFTCGMNMLRGKVLVQ